MKCGKCGKDNNDNARFCKYCGSPLDIAGFTKCPNGHNYKASLPSCPHCPSSDTEKTVLEAPAFSKPAGYTPSAEINDRTVIDTGAPKLAPNPMGSSPKPFNPEATVILQPGSSPQQPITNLGIGGGIPQSVPQQNTGKLVGWLVTFDINPIGTDFKLFEGRTRIGSRPGNQVVIQRPGISDEHALLLYREGKFVIQDNLSTNGTFINGVSIEDKTQLFDNDTITVGTVTLKLKII